MRHAKKDFISHCGCRSVGECNHNTFAEIQAMEAMVDGLTVQMKSKLKRKYLEGRSGWDDPSWTVDEIKAALVAHVEKGDPVDIANFAAFWWNKS